MHFFKTPACIVTLYVLTLGSAHAAEQKLWQYPCDVYMSSACLRLPNGMKISYSVPADSGIYTISSADKDVLSAYVGHAPNTPSGMPSLRLESATATITGFLEKRDGVNKLDVLISPKKSGSSTFHVSGLFAAEQRHDVGQILSGLRACQRKGKEDLRCPVESPWGEALQKWVSTD
jgi:hypothetical protein